MTGALAWLSEVDGCRATELDRGPIGRDVDRRQRQAGLAAAYHGAGRPFAFGWRRARRHGPVDILAAGSVLAPDGGDAGTGSAVLTVPPGARGSRLPAGVVPDLFAELPRWTRLAAVHDGLLAAEPPRPDEVPPSLEECLLRVWVEPFGWLLVAEPVVAGDLAAEAARVGALERDARTRSTPEHTVRAERLSHRYRELRRAETVGLWRVHLLAGALTPSGAASVAGLLGASADLTDLPYRLVPTPVDGDLAAVLGTDHDDADRPSPFLAGSTLVAALARAPAEEVPGVRLRPRPTFAVTPAPASDVDGQPRVPLGQVLDRNRSPVEALRLTGSSLNRHTFVTGATGAGKSQTVRALLEQASAAGLPWLVVEPAKAEYRLMGARLGPGRVIALRPGDPDGVPAGLNPLEPAPGFALQTHLDLVRALFVASFESTEPFPQILAAALARCYTDLGWDLVLGEPAVAGTDPPYPTLGDLQRTAERVVTEIGYSREITDNVLGFVRVRLASLRLGTTGRMFEGGHPIELDALLRHPVVLEIEDVGDDRDKAFLMGAVLIRLVEHLRVRQRRQPPRAGLRHLTVFEEAHRLLRRVHQPGPTAHALELFAAMLAEIRAYGEGLVIAEQIPGKLLPDVIKNTAVKVVHRLPAADDRFVVGATMNLTEAQSRYLVSLPAGTAAVFTDGMDEPLLVGMPDGSGVESAGAPRPAPVAAVVGRRSATCGPDCRAAPCTLRDMRAATRLAGTEPWVRAWAELSVLAHLTGWRTPRPRARLLASLAGLPARLRDCALSHAVDAAVRSRATVVDAPGALATHVVDALRVGDCAGEEPRWLSRPYRWALVADLLRVAHRADPGAGRHPRSAEWESSYGRPIPGATLAEQVAAVHAWLDADLRDPRAQQVVVYGADGPGALEAALGGRRTDPAWPDRVAEVASTFDDCAWVPYYLNRKEARDE